MSKQQFDKELSLMLEPEEEPGKPFHEYVEALFRKIALMWHHKWLLMGTAVAGAAIAVGVSLREPNQYIAIAALLPPDMNPPSGLELMMGMRTSSALAGALSGDAGDLFSLKSPAELYIHELQTRLVEDRMVKRFNLNTVYKAKSPESARKTLEENTKCEEDRKSGVIAVSVTDTDPNRAAAIANGYADELGRLLSDINSNAGHRERLYFEAELANARAELEQSSKALSDFSAQNGALDMPLQANATVSGMAAVQGQLIASEAELKGLLPIYSENNIRVKEARAQVAELQRQLQQIRGSAPAADKPASGTRDATGTAGGSSSRMQQLANLSPRYADLYREVTTDEATVQSLSQQLEIAKLEESRHIPDIQLLDPAQPPEHKSLPKRRRMCTEGLILGFLLGAIYVFGRDWWCKTSDDNEWKELLIPLRDKLRRVRSSELANS